MHMKNYTLFVIVLSILTFVWVFGMGWLLRNYTDLYATTTGDLLIAIGVGIVVYMSQKVTKN